MSRETPIAKHWPLAYLLHPAATNIGATRANSRICSAGHGVAGICGRPETRRRVPRFGGGRGRLRGGPAPCEAPIGLFAISLRGADASVAAPAQPAGQRMALPIDCGILQLTVSCPDAYALPGGNGGMQHLGRPVRSSAIWAALRHTRPIDRRPADAAYVARYGGFEAPAGHHRPLKRSPRAP